jgi:hypothetical protein
MAFIDLTADPLFSEDNSGLLTVEEHIRRSYKRARLVLSAYSELL